MFVVNLQGRFGNQMFQYAFAKRVSKERKSLFLFDSPKFFILSSYFKINHFPLIYDSIPLVRRWVRRWINLKKNYSYLDYLDCTICYDNLKIENNVYYDGYFQSLDYFYTIKNDILKTFKLKNVYIQAFQKKYGETFKIYKTIVMHVRRTDYLKFGSVLNFKEQDVSLPLTYYKKCLQNITDIRNYKIFIVGDDYEYISKEFSYLDNAEIVQNEMIVDFQLMLNADVLIMSNSTFAWWGAFLNQKENKRIFAPKYFLGYKEGVEFPNGIYNRTEFEQIF